MITLLIPTINRSDFLVRQLNYYKDVGFQGNICIGDSSDARHIEPTKRAIEVLRDSFNITYREYPGLNDAEVVRRLIEFVVTPYAAFVADDDFLIPNAMEQCFLFLEEHQDYNAAHGQSLTVSLKSGEPYGQIAGARHYRLPILEEESASQRILCHFSDYSVTLFSVHRTESWREMYKDVHLIPDRTFAGELLPCCLSVIQGKIKELDCLYLVRHDHSQRYLLPGPREWISNPDWLSMYQIFCDILAKELANKDCISMDKAQETVEQSFDLYMENLLGNEWRSYCGRTSVSPVDRLRRVARMIPGARLLWRALHFSYPERRFEIPLAELLDESSTYYSEFTAVHRTLTEVPAD
ncbi:TIGR00180 family glycosyltransferase [Chloroflexota bacterium]